jgi:hypothetical protein
MYTIEQVKQKLDKACMELIENDRDLLDRNVNERSVTHKLGEYLQKQFDFYKVDCEYNRIEDNPKRYSRSLNTNIAWDDKEGKTIFPDIIVHKRGSNALGDNLLVIEVKKTTNSVGRDFDTEKLKYFTDPDEKYNYQFGVFIEYDGNNFCEPEWYLHGEKYSV